jgi:carboxyl-terminal processing protease
MLLAAFAYSVSVAPAVSSAPGTGGYTTVQIPENEKPLFEVLDKVKSLVQQYYTKGVSAESLYRGMLKGMVESLGDPYSEYLDKQQLGALSTSLEGEYGGIGVTIEAINGNITVVSTFDDSPAEDAGMKAGDVIVQADGVDLRGKTISEAALLLRGSPGTSVALTVSRTLTAETLTFVVTRAVISPPTMELEELGDGLYQLRVSQFTENTALQFPVVMNYLRYKGLKGLVLDLRNNPGGLLDTAVTVAGQLVPKGPVVELRRKELKQVMESSEDIVPVPVVVLVNGGTASAAEIVAGAVRDRGVGVLVGEKTFGKGCVQAVIPISDELGGLRLTIADYYTPSGTSLAGVGLTPDFPVKPKTVDAPKPVSSSRRLLYGSIGLDVLGMQEVLKFLGYPVGEIDGVLGARTDAAMATFCQDQEFIWSGVVDQILLAKLNQAITNTAKSIADPQVEVARTMLESRVRTGSWQ